MSRSSCALACAGLLSLAAAATPAGAEQALALNAAASGPSAAEARRDAADYRDAIRELESSEGAYADQLGEHLGGLGINLQRRGKHREAVELFKRGVHLARINEGLYCPQQVPLLEREIASHLALGDYEAADERELYLYRVQMHNLDAGVERARALIRQANWQYDAFRLGLERDNYTRLMTAWDLNAQAVNDLASDSGEYSAHMLPPLHNMLRAQYLISDYNMAMAETQAQYAMVGNNGFPQDPQLSRFNLYRAQSYRKGETVAEMLYEVESGLHGAGSEQAAQALAVYGDWELFHGQRRAAAERYRAAVGELLAQDDAEAKIEALFGEPVEIPDNDAVRYLPPAVDPEQANLLLRFSVSETGRVHHLERIDDNDIDRGAANRAMRILRGTLFRPRLAAQGAVDAEGITRAYAIN